MQGGDGLLVRTGGGDPVGGTLFVDCDLTMMSLSMERLVRLSSRGSV